MNATIMVVPKWFPLTQETMRRLHEHKYILNYWNMAQFFNPNIYNIIIVQSTRLILESILSRSMEINFKTNYHYCKLMARIEMIIRNIPKNPEAQMRQMGKRNIFDIHQELVTVGLMYTNYLENISDGIGNNLGDVLKRFPNVNSKTQFLYKGK